MPDSLHWLGITKIDDLVSMSDMKYNAIVGSGIQVRESHTWLGSFGLLADGCCLPHSVCRS
jgi:GTP cyclohydrolase II